MGNLLNRAVETDTLADDEHWMAVALQAARNAAEQGEVPVGAVLLHRPDGAVATLVACSHNQPIARNDPTAHAEMLTLRQAATQLGNYRLDHCELYVTLEPCAMCAQAMLHARLRRVVFGATEPKTGAAGSVLNLFAVPQLNHHTKVKGGVLADACGALLSEFFQGRRKDAKRHATPLRDDALRTPDACFAPVWAAWSHWADRSRYCQALPALSQLRLHWLDLGPTDGNPPWLGLHGPEAWWPQLASWAVTQVKAGERVLLPDLIGFGQSDKPKKPHWHSLERHARILLAWLDEQRVPQVRLVWAPGQCQLAAVLHEMAPERVFTMQPLSSDELTPLSQEWMALPFPDAGHRAGQKAWAVGGWAA